MNLFTKIPTIILILVVLACEKSEVDNPSPEIEFEQFEIFGETMSPDSAWITFKFIDEDGDLGSDDSTQNCLMNYFEEVDGEWVLFQEFERGFTLPNLTPDARNTFIEGTISLAIKPAPIFNINTEDDYKWTLQIWDRAGNASNIIETQKLVKE